MSQVAARVEAVYRRIRAAAGRAGRSEKEITLVAVTKTYPPAVVIEAYQAGLDHFGENRAGEGRAKAAALAEWRQDHPAEVNSPPTWHLIGHLQSRQVTEAVGVYGLIHSVDSLKLAQRIDRLAKQGHYPPVEVLLQCNVSGEETKSGFSLDRWATDHSQWETFLETVSQMGRLEHVVIRGLMTIAPLVDDPEEARPCFQSLAALRQKLQVKMPGCDWGHLSMGMTDDFEIAIEEGATLVRVGRALFGERIYL